MSNLTSLPLTLGGTPSHPTPQQVYSNHRQGPPAAWGPVLTEEGPGEEVVTQHRGMLQMPGLSERVSQTGTLSGCMKVQGMPGQL